jgi:hypothetical protein
MRLIDVDKSINEIEAMEIPEQTKILFKNILCTAETAYDIDRVVEALKENSSNFQKSYKRDNNIKFHKTHKAIQLNKAIEIVKTVNKDIDYISENAKEEYER